MSVPAAHKLREGIEKLVASNRFGGGKGYVDKQGRLLPGHMFTLGLLIVTGIVYLLGYLYLRPPQPVLALPALFYVLLLFLVGTFLLEFATFLCDQLNVPVGVLTLVFVLLYFISDTDHYYPLIAPKVLAEKQKSQLDSEATIGAKGQQQQSGIVSLAAAKEQSSQGHGEVKTTGGAE
jgi:hypothetical protein